MSEIRVSKIANEAGTGAVELTQGATLPSGKTISGAGTLALNTSGTSAGLTGTPSITVADITGIGANLTGVVTATSGSFSGNVTVGGVLTYEDVTNVDSLGIVTARNGVRVTAGGINVTAGISTLAAATATTLTASGLLTASAGIHLNKEILEEVNITAGKLSDNTNIDIANGQVHLFTTAESTTSTPNIRYDGSTTLNSKMSVGQSIVVTLITTANASAYSANITVDGNAVTENWVGGSAPSGGGSSGIDVHTFTLVKTAANTYTCLANHTKTS